jgi:hypothetical protein
MFLASYTSANVYRWANVYGTDAAIYGNSFRALATDASGNVYAGGSIGGANGDVGGSKLPFGLAGNTAAVIASYTNAGAHRWSKSFVPGSSDAYRDAQVYAVAADKLGSVAFAMSFRDTVDVGGGTITTAFHGQIAGVVAMYDASTGTFARQRSFVTAPPFETDAMAFDASNNLWMAGNSNNGGQDFGSGPLPSGAFVAEYGNDLGYKFARIGAGGAYAYSYGVAPLASGDVMAMGSITQGGIDWGAGTALFTGGGGSDLWIARMRPLPFTNGLSAHYSARDTTTVARNGAGVVSSWIDTSGGSHSLAPGASAPVYGATTVNAQPGISFSGGKSMTATVPLTTDVTVFVVVKAGTSTPAAAWGPIAYHGDRSADWSLEQKATSAHFKSNADDTGAELTCTPGSYYVLTGRISGSSRTFSRTDSLGTTSATATGVTITAGNKALTFGAAGSDASNASIGEVVYFNRALTDPEVAQMVAHLGAAWGI